MRIKKIMKYDQNKYRLIRIMWERGVVGDGGYSAKLSFALKRELIEYKKVHAGWIFCLFGLRIHYLRSYGGTFA